MNRVFLLTLLLLATGATRHAMSQDTTSTFDTLTLNQAIEIALRNNRETKNAKLEIDKANDKLDAYRTRRLPSFKVSSLISQPLTSFDTTFEKGVFGTYDGIGSIPNEDVVITSSTNTTGLLISQVTQPITQLRRIGLQIKQQQVGVEISETQLRAKEQALVNEVKRAYYAILQTEGAARAAEESVKLYKELDRVTGEYVMQQVALKTDLMDVQTRVAKAEYEVLTLTNALSAQKEQLNNLLGRDVTRNSALPMQRKQRKSRCARPISSKRASARSNNDRRFAKLV